MAYAILSHLLCEDLANMIVGLNADRNIEIFMNQYNRVMEQLITKFTPECSNCKCKTYRLSNSVEKIRELINQMNWANNRLRIARNYIQYLDFRPYKCIRCLSLAKSENSTFD